MRLFGGMKQYPSSAPSFTKVYIALKCSAKSDERTTSLVLEPIQSELKSPIENVVVFDRM